MHGKSTDIPSHSHFSPCLVGILNSWAQPFRMVLPIGSSWVGFCLPFLLRMAIDPVPKRCIFRWIRKAILKNAISIVMSARPSCWPSVFLEWSDRYWPDFPLSFVLDVFTKVFSMFKCCFKSDKHNRQVTWRPTYVYNFSPLLVFATEIVFSLRYELMSKKVDDLKTTVYPFTISRLLRDIDCICFCVHWLFNVFHDSGKCLSRLCNCWHFKETPACFLAAANLRVSEYCLLIGWTWSLHSRETHDAGNGTILACN
jgi:hypothetical protein